MKTFIYLCITAIVGTGAFLSALSLSNPYPAYAVGFGIWILFFWGIAKRSQTASRRTQREQQYDEWMYHQNRNN